MTISNIPATISDQPFNIDVSVVGAQSGTNYLRVNFFPPSTTQYFGYTFNNTAYINGSDYSQYLPITINSSGNWTGNLQTKVDISSNYYTGPGNYSLKVRRYTQSGSSYTWSNEVPIIISLSIPSPSPSPTPMPSPTPSPSTSPSPSPTTTFLISEVPLQINSDQSFKVKVEFQKTDAINSKFYLKGAFKKSGSSNYFGQTSVSGNWIKNNEAYNKQFLITTNSSGDWSGEILVRPDPDDTGFTGDGSYDFKVGRYEYDSSSVSWSNEKIITISQVFQPQLANTPQTSPTATPESSPTTIKSPLPTSRSSPKISATTYSSSTFESSKSATVAGTQADYKNNPSEQSGKFNLLTISGILLVISTPIIWYLRSKFL